MDLLAVRSLLPGYLELLDPLLHFAHFGQQPAENTVGRKELRIASTARCAYGIPFSSSPRFSYSRAMVTKASACFGFSSSCFSSSRRPPSESLANSNDP